MKQASLLTYFLVTLATTLPNVASAIEITPFIGQAIGSDLVDDSDNELSVDSGNTFGLGIAWKSGHNGKGQILIASTSHEFDTALGGKSEMDLLYTHFNGVLEFKQFHYTTTIAMGLGATYTDVEGGKDSIYPSFTAALGTRYEIDKNFSVVTEIRSYITLADEDNDVFCQEGSCLANYENALWFDTSITLGIAYRF